MAARPDVRRGSNANAFFEADPVAVEIEGGLTAPITMTI
jgi:hypothetical protein